MKLSLLFADCEVASVDHADSGVSIRLSAAHVEQAATSQTEKPLSGFSRGVNLFLEGATLHEATALFGRVSAGRVQLAGQWKSSIPLPLLHVGPVTLELAFANQSQLTVSAHGLQCRFNGDANFAESYFC
ncbi:hypothetical protein HLB44_34580 [Aquincola sp. S2]|uniref:Uncharacterized protein n=1 Tax=Pseudaquabacterium terrae TaxID=2732868 RepID=A0ABX2EU02_9BURK|nr:hypothetical protein [Aquabacterium terrae]NRF72123.1 hypothetical protein [Aquabacterium terrae]